MTEAQQYELGSYLNLMNASTQLLVNSIVGLQPKFDIRDFEQFISNNNGKFDDKQAALIISLSNLLYKINLDEKDKKLLWKSFKGNKKFLSSIEMSKRNFQFTIMETVGKALRYKYHLEKY